jgi:hypothetical protein
MRALLRERMADALPQPAIAARYQCHRALQVHRFSPLMRTNCGDNAPNPSAPVKRNEPKCASEPSSGHLAMGQQFGFGVEIGIGRAGGVATGSGRQALLIARKAAVAQATAEVATPDAIWQILRRGRDRD